MEGQRHDGGAGRLLGQITGRGSNVQVGVLQRNGRSQSVLEFFTRNIKFEYSRKLIIFSAYLVETRSEHQKGSRALVASGSLAGRLVVALQHVLCLSLA